MRSLLVRGLLLAALALPLIAVPASPRISILQQVIAVRDGGVWPKLSLLPDGTIVAATYNQAAHGSRPGGVDLHASTDGGRTWSKRSTATTHRGASARFNHAIGLAPNGELLVVSGGWDYDGPSAKDTYKKKKLLRPTASRSADAGRTWVISDRFPDGADGMTLVPFGSIQTGADGALHVAAFSYNTSPTPRVDICYTVVSRDGGITWTRGSVLGQPDANETDLLHLGGGKWLAAVRNLGRAGARGHSTDIYASTDDAKSWRKIATPTEASQHPGDLLQLADGRVVLTVGDRREAHRGVTAMVSVDQGRTWSAGVPIATGVLTGDSGYPSSVQLKDGTIVTGYYASKSKDYDGYQMVAVRWRLP